MKITEKEKAILNIIRINSIIKKDEVTRIVRIGNLKIRYHWRSPKNLWGRFGGGWNWKLGFQAGGGTLILNCLTFDLVFTIEQKKES